MNRGKSIGISIVVAIIVFFLFSYLFAGALSIPIIRLLLPLFGISKFNISQVQLNFIGNITSIIINCAALIPALIAFKIARSLSLPETQPGQKRIWASAIAGLWAIFGFLSIGLIFLELAAIQFAGSTIPTGVFLLEAVPIFIAPIIFGVGSYAGFKLSKTPTAVRWILFTLPVIDILLITQSFFASTTI